MSKIDIKAAIRIATEAAKKYEQHLNNRHFMVVYEENSKTKIAKLGFRNMNFLHLTGIETNLKRNIS